MTYFAPEETSCKCGCGLDIRPELRKALDDIRGEFGAPLLVTSGARCMVYNASVGGVRDSQHLKGLAADIIWPVTQVGRKRLLELLVNSGDFSGFGFYPGFIHVDMRHLNTPPRTGAVWVK